METLTMSKDGLFIPKSLLGEVKEVKIQKDKTSLMVIPIVAEPRTPKKKEQSGADFLLSIAGCFDTGANNTSEEVHSVVNDFLFNKHKLKSDVSNS